MLAIYYDGIFAAVGFVMIIPVAILVSLLMDSYSGGTTERAICRDLKSQGFHVYSIRTNHEVATIRNPNGSDYEVKIKKVGGLWTVVGDDQELSSTHHH